MNSPLRHARAVYLSMAMAYAGCGARSGLYEPAPDAASADSRAEDAQLPTMGCIVPAVPSLVRRGNGPGFVYSLDPLVPAGGQYLLVSAIGWTPGEGLALDTLGANLASTGSRSLGTGPAWGRVSSTSNEVAMLVAPDYNAPLRFERRHLGARFGEVIETRTLCPRACFASHGGGPLEGPEGWAAAVTVDGSASTVVDVIPRDGSAVRSSGPIDLAQSALTGDSAGLRVVGLNGGELAMVRLGWDGRPSAPLSRLGVLVNGVSPGVVSLGIDRSMVAAVARDTSGMGLALFEIAGSSLTRRAIVDPDVVITNNVALRVSGNLLAVAWGEVDTRNRGGAYLAVYDLRDGTALLPARNLTNGRHGSYTIWVDVAPHPDGFALVWGGWEPSTYYAVYGTIVRCRAR